MSQTRTLYSSQNCLKDSKDNQKRTCERFNTHKHIYREKITEMTSKTFVQRKKNTPINLRIFLHSKTLWQQRNCEKFEDFNKIFEINLKPAFSTRWFQKRWLDWKKIEVLEMSSLSLVLKSIDDMWKKLMYKYDCFDKILRKGM